MTEYCIVSDHEIIDILDDTNRDQHVYYFASGDHIEWLWDYAKPQLPVSEDKDEPDDEWITVDRFDMLPAGLKCRVRAVDYKNGDHFGRDRIGNSIVNPDEKDMRDLWSDLLFRYEKCVGIDHFTIYSEHDFTSGQWMGDPADWKSQGYRERITLGKSLSESTYEFEEYEETEDAE